MGRWWTCYVLLCSADFLTPSSAHSSSSSYSFSLRHNTDVEDVHQSGRALQGAVVTDPACNVDNAQYTTSAGEFQENAGFPPQSFAGTYGFGECAMACKNDYPCHYFSWNAATGACRFFQQADSPILTSPAQGWKSGAVSCSVATSSVQAVPSTATPSSVPPVPSSQVGSPLPPDAPPSVPPTQRSSPAPSPFAAVASTASASAPSTDEVLATKTTSAVHETETRQESALALLAYPYWLWLIWLIMAAVIVGVCVYTMRQVDRDGKRRKSRRVEEEESDSTQDAQISPTAGYELLNTGKQELSPQLPTTLPSGVPLPPSTLIQAQSAFIPGTHK